MYAHYATYLSPTTFSGLLSASFVVMLIIGGIGTVSGAFAGAVFVVLLPELLRFVGDYYMLVYVTVVMLSIMFLPGGIIPTLRRARGNIKSIDVLKMFFDTGRKGNDGNE